jgi:hypothetical protein
VLTGKRRGRKMKSPHEALLIASAEIRKKSGLSPGQPCRLEDLKQAYFEQGPVSFQQSTNNKDEGKELKSRAVTTSPKVRETTHAPITAPDKPQSEGDIEAMMKAFKEGRKKNGK